MYGSKALKAADASFSRSDISKDGRDNKLNGQVVSFAFVTKEEMNVKEPFVKGESKDISQKNLESFPDVTADILNVFLYEGRCAVHAECLYPAPTETAYAVPGSALRSQLEDVSKYEVRRNLPPEKRALFHSDMRHVVDYLAEGNGFRSEQPVVHKEALIRLLRALGGDPDVEDTARMLEEMHINEEDEITMCELFDQYTRRGKEEGREEGRISLISRMLSNGMDRSAILQYTDCTEEELGLAAALQ